MRTRALATTLLALAVAVGWPATPAEAYGGTTTLTYNEQLTGYGATWRDPWDPYYEEYCYWWEEDPWWGWYCVAWYEWENFAHVSTGLYTPSGTWVAGSGATHWDHAQVDLTPLTPTEYGTWNHYANHYQFQQEWHFDGFQWHYTEYYHFVGGTSAPAYVPPPPSISSLNPVSGPVGTPVEIHGSDFGASGTVTFNGVTAGIVQWGTTRIDTIVPDVGTTGPVPVVVTVAGRPSNSATFTVEAPPQPPAEQLFYYHTDALGSVRMITDENGQMVGDRYDYVPFGTPWPYDTDPEIRRFAQLERTLETGNATWLALDYAGARYYHGQTGRFTTPDDSVFIDPLNPQSWNLCAYALNNPLRYVDPTGTQGIVAFGECGGAHDVCVNGESVDPGTLKFLIDSENRPWERTILQPPPPTSPCQSNCLEIGLPSWLGPALDIASLWWPIRGLRGLAALRTARGARESTTVIGKLDDLKNLAPGERTLLDRLPNLGSPRANWYQNSSVLRQEMALGRPIRDASVLLAD